MTPGPAPKPTALKKLHQTFRPDRAPENEATPNLASADQLKAPDWLSEAATAKWNELALQLRHVGILTVCDLDILAAYCTSFTNWREAEEKVKEHGATTTAQSGFQAVSPHVTRAKNHLGEVIKLSSLLGLNPSARTRIETNPVEKPEDGLLV